MAARREFAHILREKMDFPLEKEEISSPIKGQTSYSLHHSVGFYINPYSWTPKKTATAYKKKAQIQQPKTKVTTKKVTPPKIITTGPCFKFSTFTNEEQTSLNTFISFGAQIDTNKISLFHLKKEYRRLVKEIHPDYSKNNNAQVNFQKFHNAYKTICSKLNKLTKEKI